MPSQPKTRSIPHAQSFFFKIRLFLLYSFPVVLFCSYYPVIPIVSTASTNYELSLPLIWLFLFSVLSLKDFFAVIYNIYNKHRFYLLGLLFPIYLSTSALWSSNPLRAIMTAGILWCIIITSITLLTIFRTNKHFDKNRFFKIFFYSTAAFCILCWVQSILDCFDVDRSITLLCSGCVSYSFGFPHPSGLAIEPQFMGNLLLAPTLTALYFWAQSKKGAKEDLPFSPRTFLIFSFLFSSTLFLTFSRGAIYSFGVAFIAIFIVSVIKLRQKGFWRTLPLLFLSFVFTLFMQGVFSAVSYTDSTFLGGIKKSISQISLGQIELQLEPEYPTGNDVLPTQSSSTEEASTMTPVFNGYVEESTNTRVRFNSIALELSPRTPATFVFGYGLGSAGETMFKEGKTASAYELIQNEFFSLLLETGILGLLLAAFTAVIAYNATKNLARPHRYLLGSIALSFLFSLLFFSGLPNATHLYLFPVFLLTILPLPRPAQSSQNRSSSRA